MVHDPAAPIEPRCKHSAKTDKNYVENGVKGANVNDIEAHRKSSFEHASKVASDVKVARIVHRVRLKCCHGSLYLKEKTNSLETRSKVCLESLIIDKKELKTLRVDKNNIIWRCKKVLSFSYDCCFAFCQLCYAAALSKNSRRNKRAKLDKDSCDYESLVPCDEMKFFMESCLDRLTKEELKKFPSKCSHCKSAFMNQ